MLPDAFTFLHISFHGRYKLIQKNLPLVWKVLLSKCRSYQRKYFYALILINFQHFRQKNEDPSNG